MRFGELIKGKINCLLELELNRWINFKWMKFILLFLKFYRLFSDIFNFQNNAEKLL